MARLKIFNRNDGSMKKKIIIGIYAFLIIGIILTGASYAVYQQEAEVTFINARVGNFKENDIELAIKLNGEQVDTPPEKNSLYTVTVDCDNATGRWDMNEWGAMVTNINANKVKCEVNFNTPAPTLSDITATSEKTSIALSYTASGIGTSTTCKYGTEEGTYTNSVKEVQNTSCNITGLEMDTTYYYQVCAINATGEVCKDDNIKTKRKVAEKVEDVEIGDYISMTPTSTSYKMSKGLTGYTRDQTINPSELNLWRVIKKNDDGTVEMVSEYVSDEIIFISGNSDSSVTSLLGTLGAQFGNDSYTISTRVVGYENSKKTCIGLSGSSCLTPENSQDLKSVKSLYGSYITSTVEGTKSSYWIYGGGKTSLLTNTTGFYYSQWGESFKCLDSGTMEIVKMDNCQRFEEGGLLVDKEDGLVKVGAIRYTEGSKTNYIPITKGARVRIIATVLASTYIVSGTGQNPSDPYAFV